MGELAVLRIARSLGWRQGSKIKCGALREDTMHANGQTSLDLAVGQLSFF